MTDLRKIDRGLCLAEYSSYAKAHCLISGFWTNIAVRADIYAILEDESVIGYTSYLPMEQTLTAFFMREGFESQMQLAFEAVMRILQPASARIMTNDAVFIASAFEYAGKVDQQAYLFSFTSKPVSLPSLPRSWLQPATEQDIPCLADTKFYDRVDLSDTSNQLFVLRDPDGRFMGTGHIFHPFQNPVWGAVGMYTVPEFRRQGVGRSIIMALTQLVKEDGLTPICCCNVHNQASKKTLESSGYACTSKYVNLYFRQ